MTETSKRLQPAVQVARLREDAAAREHNTLQLTVAKYEAQLQQLLDFQQEYSEEFETAGRAGTSIRHLRDFNAFLTNLNRNIYQLRQHLAGLKMECQRKKQNWLNLRTKTEALKKLIERHNLEQNYRTTQLEQAETEEYVHSRLTSRDP